jgi:predicted thioesterase
MPGPAVRHEHTVSAADTALAAGSGDVPVLATPRVVAWAEAACVAACADTLAGDPALGDATTVGTAVRLDHLAPSGVGTRVLVSAELTARDGRLLHFEVRVDDPGGRLLARGAFTRAVVARERFIASVPTA